MRFGLSKKTRVISYCLGQCRPASSILERKGSLEALFDCYRCHLQKTSWMGQNGATLFVMHIAYTTCRPTTPSSCVEKNEGSSSGHSHLDAIFIYTTICMHHHFHWRIFGQMETFLLAFSVLNSTGYYYFFQRWILNFMAAHTHAIKEWY